MNIIVIYIKYADRKHHEIIKVYSIKISINVQ